MRRRKYTREDVLGLMAFWGQQAAASRAVNYEVRAGRIPPARDFQCTDCSRPAYCYDHRDYAKPFDVEPVCASCNGKRGRAKAA